MFKLSQHQSKPKDIKFATKFLRPVSKWIECIKCKECDTIIYVNDVSMYGKLNI